jgi:tetratricopeptide (TPR) repeat protein
VAAFFIFRDAPERPQPPAANVSQNPAHSNEVDMAMLNNLPNDYATLVQLGNEQMDQQQFSVAAEIYRRALEIDGSSPDVRADYGACLHAMGLGERAIEEFQKVRGTHPDHAIVHFNLGIVYYTMNQADSARYYWSEYLRIDPEGVASATARQLMEELKP